MRRIGLLGGMSWETSAVYYRFINEQVRDRLGALHSADCLLRSVDFAEIKRLQREGRWDEAGDRLAAEARALVAGGAELLVLCTNTMHKVADAVAEAIEVPFVHIADATADAITPSGVRTVGLLATAYTMEQDFYVERLRRRHGLDVLVPDSRDRAEVHRIIYEELVVGRVKQDSRATYQRIISNLVGRGAQAILLGCTEIDLLIGPSGSPVPTFDTTELHAQRAVELALSGSADATMRSATDIHALDHIVLTVRDLHATLRFYEQALGMQPVIFDEGLHALNFGRQKINLHEAGRELDPKARQTTPGSGDLCLLTRRPLSEIGQRLRELGIAIEEGPVDQTGARRPLRSIYVRDPDGNLVEIANER